MSTSKSTTAWRSAVVQIPNAITTANILCGFMAIIASINGELRAAAWLIVIAGLFDLVDGRIARLLDATTEFGGYFDTLSDQLSFGVAPAILFYQAGLRDVAVVGWVLPFVYALSVSFRLARFSVRALPTEKGFFRGLSSPVSACTGAALVLFLLVQGFRTETKMTFLAATSLLLAVLMVSRMRFPSFKNMNWKSPAGYAVMVIGIGGVLICAFYPSLLLFPVLAVFILSILTWNLLSLLNTTSASNHLTQK